MKCSSMIKPNALLKMSEVDEILHYMSAGLYEESYFGTLDGNAEGCQIGRK